MKAFKNYLIGQGLVSSSASSYTRSAQQFLDWLQLEDLSESHLSGNDIMNYFQHLKVKGHVQKSLRHQLTVLRHYFQYQGYSLRILAKLKIKGIHHELPKQIITEAELLRIYETYPIEIELDKRDKCMLGLLVFQGITTRELMELNLLEIDTENQILEIKAARATAGRRLVLRDIQIKDLQNYLNQVRPELLAIKLKPTDQFFLTNGTSLKKEALKNSIQRISDILKNRLSSYKHTRQLRASVISNWLLHSSLRQVQYMAGHKYISSTERYQLGRIVEIEEALLKYHPNR